MNRSKNILDKEVIEQKSFNALRWRLQNTLSGDNASLILIGIRNSGFALAEK